MDQQIEDQSQIHPNADLKSGDVSRPQSLRVYDEENEEVRRQSNIQKIEEMQEELKHGQENFLKDTTRDNELSNNLKISIDLVNDVIVMQKSLVSDIDDEKTTTLFLRITNILTTLQGQLSFTLEAMELEKEHGMDPQVIEKLTQKYASLETHTIPLKLQEDICHVTLEYALDFLLHNLLSELLRVVHKFFEKDKIVKKPSKMHALQIIAGKLETVIDYYPDAVCFNRQDIFGLHKSEPFWKDIFKLVEFREIAPGHQITKSFNGFCKNILLANAMLSKSNEQESEAMKNVTLAFGAVYYFFMEAQAHKQANLFYSAPDTKTAFKVWNLMDSKLIKEMMKVVLPPIKHKQVIYIHRATPSITLPKIQAAFDDGSLNKITHGWLDTKDENEAVELLSCAMRNRNKDELLKKGADKVPIRILAHKPLPDLNSCLLNQKPLPRKVSLFDRILGKGIDPNDPNLDGIVIHIHGGGFVAMSSSSHQTYTRQWANLIRKPIFSLDYRLAPEHPYPAALDDCWQAYNWVLDNVEDITGVKPSKIILAGDSAGGNLALSVTLMAIKTGIRVPDGLLLVYPALNLNAMRFSPSYLLAIDDQLLTYNFLKLCVKAYVPEGSNPDADPFLSPIWASPELLAKLPPARLMVGTKDPLHDESWRFIDKVHKYQPNTKMIVYKEFPHGFLNFDVPQGMKEAKETVRDAAAILLELFEL